MKITPQQYAISLYEATDKKTKQEVQHILDNFVQILQNNNHLRLEKKIVEEYYKYYKKKQNISSLVVTSQKKLSKDILHKIIKKFQNQVEIQEKIDEDMIGGIQLEINEQIFIDGSIKTQLKNIRNIIQ